MIDSFSIAGPNMLSDDIFEKSKIYTHHKQVNESEKYI